MAVYKRGRVWWYEFIYAGQHIQESSNSKSKTVAIDAERNAASANTDTTVWKIHGKIASGRCQTWRPSTWRNTG